MTIKSVTITITNCKHCPNCRKKTTKGYGYAMDFYCDATMDNRVIAGSCESPLDEPRDGIIPAWCPLAK